MDKRNLLYDIDSYIELRQWKNGLSKFEQDNCSCSLTDQGFRIYRPGGLTISEHGYTMFGGLVIHPFDVNPEVLKEGHSYVILFDVKGCTSNEPVCYWSHNVGWETPELSPDLTSVDTNSPIKSPFNSLSYVTYRYEFTVNDELYKTCEKSYSNFEKGKSYLSYRDFFFGFTYRSTGEMGTDLYIRNIRMYDITKQEVIEYLEEKQLRSLSDTDDLVLGADRELTNGKTVTGASANTKFDVSKKGITRLLSLQENQDVRDGTKKASISYTGEVYAADFIEM